MKLMPVSLATPPRKTSSPRTILCESRFCDTLITPGTADSAARSPPATSFFQPVLVPRHRMAKKKKIRTEFRKKPGLPGPGSSGLDQAFPHRGPHGRTESAARRAYQRAQRRVDAENAHLVEDQASQARSIAPHGLWCRLVDVPGRSTCYPVQGLISTVQECRWPLRYQSRPRGAAENAQHRSAPRRRRRRPGPISSLARKRRHHRRQSSRGTESLSRADARPSQHVPGHECRSIADRR